MVFFDLQVEINTMMGTTLHTDSPCLLQGIVSYWLIDLTLQEYVIY